MDIERKTVFLVDDNTTNLTAGKAVLAERYKVLTLDSGERLLKILEKNIPDLILLDIEMPEINGYETIKAIKNKRETEHIPVIFLTAKSDVDNELEGLSLGAIDYITKPFSPSLLLKRIEVHLLVETQKRELRNYNHHLQEMVESKTKSVVKLQDAILKTMIEFVERRDYVTGGHIERTTHYLNTLLNAMRKYGLQKEKISSWNLNLILQSARLHDVGKIAIKDSILQKSGNLTPVEFEEMKKHTIVGEEIIEEIKRNSEEQAFLEHAGIFAATHHEKWDGNGYPRGLRGEEIPLQGRLLAIADVYDALVSERPYKEAFSHEKAVEIISKGKGTHFDPQLIELFLNVSDEFEKYHLSLKEGTKI
ncbi:MAG: response regulator [Candidatus Fibromonas sp.]|jgi:putative two-component system response regulator|nr:response regulator [Candidatus Fibromonas sp.]